MANIAAKNLRSCYAKSSATITSSSALLQTQVRTSVLHSWALSTIDSKKQRLTNGRTRKFSALAGDGLANSVTTAETVLVGTEGVDVTTTSAAAGGARCPFHKLMQAFDNGKSLAQSTARCAEKLKSFSELPTPKPLPGNMLPGELGLWYERLFKSDLKNKFHEYVDMRSKQVGPVYREKIGALNGVFISDPVDVAKVFSLEGKHPRHVVPDPWKMQMEVTKQPRGLFFLDGERWQKKRRIMNQALMRKDAVPTHIPNFVRVVDDLLSVWAAKRQANKNVVTKIDEDLFHFAIESTGTILFNERLGCLDATPPKQITEFINSLRELFNNTLGLLMVPLPVLRHFGRFIPQWRRFTALWNKQLQIAQDLTAAQLDKAVERFNENKTQLQNSQLVYRLLASDKLTMEQVVRLVTDLFSAGADTVSNTLIWTMYLLSKNPEAQARIAQEMSQIVPVSTTSNTTNSDLDVDQFQNMKFTKAVLRESMRLYPIVPFHTRILDHDISLRGYHIPRETTFIMCAYTMGRNEAFFKDANTFNPERWLRSSSPTSGETATDEHKRQMGFASLPYGYGPRGCVARRLADPMMMLAIGKLCQKYQFSFANERDLAIHNRMILVPDQPLQLHMTERQ